MTCGLMGIGCDDTSINERNSATFSTEREEYVFPPPSFESQSSVLDVKIQNNGGSSLVIIEMIIVEDDDVKEIDLLDRDDWDAGPVTIPAQSERRLRFGWSVLDAQPDNVLVTFITNIGEYQIRLTTPDLDPNLFVVTDPEATGDLRGARIELSEVPAGGVGRVRATLQSIGVIELTVNSVCFINSENECIEGRRDGSFSLCDGSPNTLNDCEPLPPVGTLLSGATKTMSVFYAPNAGQIDAEVAQLQVRSDSVENPTYLLTIQGSPCERSESTPICGGCGDGEITGAEECDDGNLDMSDACLNGCVLARCGDGILQAGIEECDDGNESDTDACTQQCQAARCGDGFVQGEEECDDRGESPECDLDCTATGCGDGVVNISAGELCDDGEQSATCDIDCTPAECGDGLINEAAGERCDDGNMDDGDGCSSTCEVEQGFICDEEPSRCESVCGDEITAGEEECDEGASTPEEVSACDYGLTECVVCDETCREVPGAVRFCGDGTLDADEEACDDGNGIAGDGCSDACVVEPGYLCDGSPSICVTICGDGIRAGEEECDDNNTVTETCAYGLTQCEVCDETCREVPGTARFCGDGTLDADEEACDDGNGVAGDGCSDTCVVEPGYLCDGSPSICVTTCGDGVRAGEEECDDNNTVTEVCDYGLTQCEVCDETCREVPGAVRFCGDGTLDADEEACDDGNGVAGDGCSDTCVVEPGYLCDGSPSICVTTCGDGVRAGEEECDDNNTVTEVCDYGLTQCEVCDETCREVPGAVRFCGDGTLDADEEACDDGNGDAGDGCSGTCVVEPGYLCDGSPSICVTTCGDGVRAGEEECDDNNTVTEVCDYGLTQCEVCDETCREVPGAVRFCGDGTLDADEEACDDGNGDAGDGCSGTCVVEPGYLCDGSPSICVTTCGDGVRAGEEECDDNNTVTEVCDYGLTQCEVCDETCREVPGAVRFCGDGTLDADEEACDDGNGVAGDGCSDTCVVEPGYLCDGSPSLCVTTCGDGIRAGEEECDDNNTVTETCDYGLTQCDVCDETCREVPGEIRFCGDGTLDADDEACDDANSAAGDGCSDTCVVEPGYICNGSPSVCVTVCGDNIRAGDEGCDDGNNITDECQYNELSCEVCQEGCVLGDGVVSFCGDGIPNGPEECDQGDDNGGGVCGYNVRPCRSCNETCELEDGVEIYCGDGIVQPEFEDCDGSRGCSETCTLPCSPNCPFIEMIDIPAGSFTMGSSFYPQTRPTRTVTLASGFQMSKSEITVAQYQLCVDANFCTPHLNLGVDCNLVTEPDQPRNCISRAQLKEFATWVGADLPSEAEWEYAARFSTGYLYPWGNNNTTICALKRAQYSDCVPPTVRVCSFDGGITQEGLCDMSGNVSEWTLDHYKDDHTGSPVDGTPWCSTANCDDDVPEGWVTKGGSYLSPDRDILLIWRQGERSATTATGGRIVRF